MKNYFIKLVLIVNLSVFLFASGFTGKEIMFVPYGPEGVTFADYPEGRYGPMSFQIEDKKIHILDSQSESVKTFSKGKMLSKHKIAVPSAVDFLIRPENIIYQTPTAVYRSQNDQVKEIFHSPDPSKIISDLSHNKKDLSFRLESDVVNINSGGHPVRFSNPRYQILRSSSGIS